MRPPRRWARWLWAVLLVAPGACGTSTGGKALGEPCGASTECGPDLICNFSATPYVCSANGPLPADAGVPDAFMIKVDAPPGTPDAKPKPIDAATPDASPPDAMPAGPDASLPDAMM